ncbi:MAG: C39 family peptidase [Anaerolineales bacterium]
MVKRYLALINSLTGALAWAALGLSLFSPTLALAQSIPERAAVSGLVGYPQRFTLSCESRSAVDWAGYWGVNIREKKFLNSLPRTDNPDTGFVGNPNGEWGSLPPNSYGVHAEPVAALLRAYGLQAEAISGLSWDELRAEIAAGHPVIVWVIGQMWRGSPQRYTPSDGQTTTVARYEHTMILVGYDPQRV